MIVGIFDGTISAESMTHKVVNARLKFLHRKNKYLTQICVDY